MNLSFDTYTRRARFHPALLVALPVCIAIFSWFPKGLMGWGTFWSLFVFCGGTALLAQIGRDLGKKKELKLFEIWGGKPTTRMLRHLNATNRDLLLHRHRKFQEILPNLKIPSLEEEKDDPSEADSIYETCVTFLREKTRNQKKFPLVFEENCNYGFRRNLWGMKPLGVLSTIIGTLAVLILIIIKLFIRKADIPPIAIIAGMINFILLLLWVFRFTPEWVKTTAYAYAERLLESCDNL